MYLNFLVFKKIPVSPSYVEKIISSHSDYPSLLSIADSLERLGVEYQAWKVTRDELNSIAFPYLLPISVRGGDILLIKNSSDLKRNEEKLNYWEGTILKTEHTSLIVDKENNRQYTQESFYKVLTTITLILVATSSILSILLSFSFYNLLLIVSSYLGVFIGYLLVAKDLGIKYKNVESFCNAGKNTSCDKILNSEGAKIFGSIKFSDLVFTYFITQIGLLSLSFYLSGISLAVLTALFGITLLTIPIIIFSIYYQYFVAKAWCKLCLIVSLILIFQLPIFYFVIGDFNSHTVNLLVVLFVLFCFVVTGSLIVSIKQVIDKMIKAESLSVKANRIKNSVDVFTHLLFKERIVDYKIHGQDLSIGNPDAPIRLMMVSNLYCNPCKEQHEKISELIATYPGKINLTVRFLLSGKDVNNTVTTNQYLIQYWRENISKRNTVTNYTEKVLHDWFDMMDFEKFSRSYKIEGAIDEETLRIEKLHFDWVEYAQIMVTPTFFVNGYELPKKYSIEDLFDLAPALADYFKKKESTNHKQQLLHI